MYKKIFMMGLCLTIPLSSSAFCQHTLASMLYKAEIALDNYARKADPEDLKKFKDYLSYYKSEGGYQAVTPAPSALRDSLSKEAKELFKGIKEYAQPFTKTCRNIPGTSSLSQEGEIYYAILLKYVEKF